MTRSRALVTIAAAAITLAAAEPWRHRTAPDPAHEASHRAPATTLRDAASSTRARPEARREPPAPICRRLVRDPRKGYVEVAYRC
ncbi:MAG: hypothetical protein JHD15_03815 [Phenylobacterium sp.]|uniref:hypothetical protein n=1 Tax=Phenylobacterium sp. TaxID=1871053 RepID=UPI001A331A31|nr:hypothetical protein [Phenylobacterium sp.]MBJ7409476.1 hypothetical protein [Phenylobacterium sp.]